jgi:4-amino-4-deoxy-L-arabinose transferase-like glycosyltransferase
VTGAGWRRADAAIAAVLGALALVSVLTAQRQVGIVRDEVVYMEHGSRYADWWRDLLGGVPGTASAERITAHFGGADVTSNNREHPPLMKTLFGLSEWLLHRKLGWTSRFTGYRLPSALAGALLVSLVFLLVRPLWGRAAAALSALLVLLVPRAFFHAGLATFDGAVVTGWVAVLYCYLRALASRRWSFALGVVFGLALATKHNALLLPLPLAVHYLVLAGLRLRATGLPDGLPARLRAYLRQLLTLQPLAFAAMALLGPLVLVALWPWLWFDTAQHLRDWLRFHLDHVHYNFEYLGRNWNHPPYPFHVPLVTTALTVPVITWVAGLLGAGVLAGRAWCGRAAVPERAPALLLFLAAGAAMGPFLLGTAPIFGAEKHWAAAVVTLCIYAAIGILQAGRWAAAGLALPGRAGQLARPLSAGVLATLAVAAAAIETVVAQPYALSHYNALAGGAPGGADLGMNRQFWGYAARGVLPVLARFAPAPAGAARPVYSHDASPAWHLYRDAGLLPPGLPDAGHEEGGVRRSQLAIVIHEMHFLRHDVLIWRLYGTVRPVYVLTTDGVPIVSVYARPGVEPTGPGPQVEPLVGPGPAR